MVKCKILMLSAAALLLTQAARAEISHKDLNTQIDQTNFLVNNDCSGTLIDAEHGYILTANHCIADQFQDVKRQIVDKDGNVKEITVRISKPGDVSQIVFAGPNEVQRTSFVFKMKAHDDNVDLGLLQVVSKLPNQSATKVACVDPDRLDKVYAVGNPFAILYSTASEGVVSSTARDYRMLGIDGNGDDPSEQPGDNGLTQHTAFIAPGSSGGALLNANGELIGVNVRGGNGVFFSVPLGDVRKFLIDNKVDLTSCP